LGDFIVKYVFFVKKNLAMLQRVKIPDIVPVMAYRACGLAGKIENNFCVMILIVPTFHRPRSLTLLPM